MKSKNFIYGDINDTKLVKKIINSAHFAVALAVLVGDSITKRYPKESELINNYGTKNLIDSIIKNIIFPFRFLKSYIQSWKLLNEFKPHVVIGTGGYSSGLPLLAAIHKGIKTVIQEQNSFPGITTRHLSSRVDKICIAYEDAASHLKKKILFLQATLFGRTYS